MTRIADRMSATEVAEAFGVTTATIRRWVKLQRIPFRRLPSGRAVFFRAEIEPLIPTAAQLLAGDDAERSA